MLIKVYYIFAYPCEVGYDALKLVRFSY